MSVTSSGRSSIRRMIRYISGLFRRMDFAASFKSVVFPAFGGETIMPRWPFPIGLTRSTIRIAMLPPGRSRRSRSSGKTGVISSKLPRRMIWSSGRLLTLFKYKRALRNMREGGSLTILATALVDTGSKMDDVVYEEFKGTGNMELVLDRKLQERRVFPAIDIAKSGTRREDLLLTPDEQEAVYNMRKALNGMKSEEAVENILNMFARTRNNGELIQILKKQKIV